jgi:hypothetical protein
LVSGRGGVSGVGASGLRGVGGRGRLRLRVVTLRGRRASGGQCGVGAVLRGGAVHRRLSGLVRAGGVRDAGPYELLELKMERCETPTAASCAPPRGPIGETVCRGTLGTLRANSKTLPLVLHPGLPSACPFASAQPGRAPRSRALLQAPVCLLTSPCECLGLIGAR